MKANHIQSIENKNGITNSNRNPMTLSENTSNKQLQKSKHMKTHLHELSRLKRTYMLLKAILFILGSFFVTTPHAYAAISTATGWTNIYHAAALPATVPCRA